MKILFLTSLAILLAACSGITGTAPSIHLVDQDRAVRAGPSILPLVEPHLAIDPGDAAHLVVGAIVASPDREGPWHCAAVASHDGGASWRRHDFDMRRCIDPWVIFAPDGTVLLTAIEIHDEGEGDGRFELLRFSSSDGGRTWGEPSRLGRGHEHPMMVAGPQRGGTGSVHLLSRRTSGTGDGLTHVLHLARADSPPWRFQDRQEIDPGRAGLNVSGIARLEGGGLAVAYWESSATAGASGPEGLLPRARTFLVRQVEAGGQLSAPAPITDACASGVEGAFPGYPALAHSAPGASGSGLVLASANTRPDPGFLLYHACIAPDLRGVTLSVSPDAGLSWRAPVRVDAAAGAAARDARTPMLAVNAEGVLGVAWFEGIQDPDRGRCQDVSFTASADGGRTFAPAVRLNAERSCPETAGNGRVAQSWPMGGDYGGLAAAPDGTFVVVWADSRTGRFELRSARLVVGTQTSPAAAHDTQSSYRRARAALERARDVMGGAGRLAATGGLTFEASGTLDKGAEYQGRTPDSTDPGAFHETLTVESPDGRIAYAYREERYDGTSESVREIYPGGDDRLIVLPDSRQVVTLRSPDHPANRRRLARRFPQLLVAEVLERPAALRWLGEREGIGRLSAVLATGEVLTLTVDEGTGVLTGAEYLTDVQGFGDAVVTWTFGEYAPVERLGLFPRRYGVSVDGRPFTEMRVMRVGPAMSEHLTPPAGFAPVGPVEQGGGEDASARAAVQEIAPGIRRVTRLRTGFHPMFVEFADFVVAIDAPAGYRLLNELPAGDVAPGTSSAWLSARYIQLIREAVPGKPVRYVVLTHFHNDHAGGVRAFVAEGATVVAAPDTAALVRRLVGAPHTLAPDRLSREPRPLNLEIVHGTHVITDDTRRLEILDLGPNPHGAEMLVAHLPAERIMFVSDLLEPVALERFPLPSHETLDRFFVRWLDAARLSPERIYTMHGSGLATPAHLERLRDGIR